MEAEHEKLEGVARRLLEARDGRPLRDQLSLTRAARRYDEAAARARHRAAASPTCGQTGRQSRT